MSDSGQVGDDLDEAEACQSVYAGEEVVRSHYYRCVLAMSLQVVVPVLRLLKPLLYLNHCSPLLSSAFDLPPEQGASHTTMLVQQARLRHLASLDVVQHVRNAEPMCSGLWEPSTGRQ